MRKASWTASYLWGDEAMHAESRTFAMKITWNSFDNYLGYSLRSTKTKPKADPIQRWSWVTRKALGERHELHHRFPLTWNLLGAIGSEVYWICFSPAGQFVPKLQICSRLHSMMSMKISIYFINWKLCKPFFTEGEIWKWIANEFSVEWNDYVVPKKMKQGNWSPTPAWHNVVSLTMKKSSQPLWNLGTNSGNWAIEAGLRAEHTDVETIFGWDHEAYPRSTPTSFRVRIWLQYFLRKNAFTIEL